MNSTVILVGAIAIASATLASLVLVAIVPAQRWFGLVMMATALIAAWLTGWVVDRPVDLSLDSPSLLGTIQLRLDRAQHEHHWAHCHSSRAAQ